VEYGEDGKPEYGKFSFEKKMANETYR